MLYIVPGILLSIQRYSRVHNILVQNGLGWNMNKGFSRRILEHQYHSRIKDHLNSAYRQRQTIRAAHAQTRQPNLEILLLECMN